MNQRNDTNKQLPEGWRWAKVGEVCRRLDYGFTASADISIKQPKFLRITDIQDGYVDWERVPGCQISENEERANSLADGDIVFARTGGTVGKSFLIRNPPRAVFASYLIRLSPNEFVESDYLYSFFQSDHYWRQIKAQAQGGAQPNVNATILASLRFPLAPLNEQNRIATIVQEQLNAVQKVREAAKEQLVAVSALPSAYLRQVFNSEEGNAWPKKRLGEAARIQSGYAFKTEWYVQDGIRLLRNANVFQGFVHWSDTARLSNERRANFESYELREGDVVLSLDRPFVSRGLKVAKLTAEDVPSLLLQRVGRFQVGNNLHPDYLFAFLNSELFAQQIKGHDYSLGVPHISPSQVEAVTIPLPPVEKQEQIVESLSAQMSVINNSQKQLEEQLEAIECLPIKLLERAFSGQL